MAKRKNILEPSPKNTVDEAQYEKEVYSAFMTYRGISTSREHKNWIVEYIRFTNRDVAKYSHDKPQKYSPYGIWARFLCRNIKIPHNEKILLDKFLTSLEEKYEEYKKLKENISNERSKKYAKMVHAYLGDINEFIDMSASLILQKKKKDIDVNKLCNRLNVPKQIYPEIETHIARQLTELIMSRDKLDEQLTEGYSYFSTSQLQSYIDVHEDIIEYYKSRAEEIKKNRKPRKKKQKTSEEICLHVQYQSADSETGLISSSPTTVVGCTSVFVFHTKIKAIILYKSKKNEILSFKGTSLLNVDYDNSFGKKIRGYDKYIKNNSLKFPTFRHAETLFSGLNTKAFRPNGRFNKNTIILSTQK